MKAGIIIILENDTMKTENFIRELSGYAEISQYELIFALEQNKKELFSNRIETYFGEEQCIQYYLVDKINNYGRIYNGAAELVTEDAIIFLQTDIILEAGCLNILCQTLEEEDILAVQPFIVGFHSLRIQSAGECLADMFISNVFGHQKEENISTLISGRRMMLSKEIFAINRYVFEELRGFDETLMSKWQVREFTMRLYAMGGVNYCTTKAKAYTMNEYQKYYQLCPMLEPYQLKQKFQKQSLLEIKDFYKMQIQNMLVKKEYVLINFSNVVLSPVSFQDMQINIKKILDYTNAGDCKKIIFEEFLPLYLLEEQVGFIYFANNLFSIEENEKWFQLRKENDDIFADLSGNFIMVKSMIS